MRIAAALLALLALVGCSPRRTSDTIAPPAQGIAVHEAWARATHAGTGAGYLTIASAAVDSLCGAEVAGGVAREVQMHTIERAADGAMSMHEVHAVAVTPTNPARFAPGSRHLMFVGLTRPLVAGETLLVTLRFMHAAPCTVRMPVRE